MFPVTSELGILSLWSQLKVLCQFLVVTETYLMNGNNFTSIQSPYKIRGVPL